MILLKNRDRNPSFKKGEYVEINDAGNYPMELSVDGVCKQETTSISAGDEYDSPSPDYPQPISTIENSLKITSCNKNLFDEKVEQGAIGGSVGQTYEQCKTSLTTRIRTINLISLDINKNYTISIKNGYEYAIFSFDDEKKSYDCGISGFALFSSKSITFNNVPNIAIAIRKEDNSSITPSEMKNSDFQIEFGTTATSYEKHLETQITANLPEGEFVGKLDDTYKDTLNVVYKEDGQYHLILNKMIGKVVLDGSENWIKSGGSSDNFFCGALSGQNVPFQAKMDTKNYTKTNYFIKRTKSSNSECFDMYNGTKYYTAFALFLSTSKVSDIASFKSWLSTHNTIVYYALATPYEIDLGVVDTLLSYNEVTNVFSDSDLYPVINVKYYKDFEFDKILRSGYNIDEQEYEIAKKQMANGKRKRILSSYDDCIIKINLGLLDNKTYQEYKEQLDDGEFHYWSYKYNQYKKANFILTKPSITTEYAYDDDIGINDMEIILEKSSDIE